jgi:hypothetical protein
MLLVVGGRKTDSESSYLIGAGLLCRAPAPLYHKGAAPFLNSSPLQSLLPALIWGVSQLPCD